MVRHPGHWKIPLRFGDTCHSSGQIQLSHGVPFTPVFPEHHLLHLLPSCNCTLYVTACLPAVDANMYHLSMLVDPHLLVDCLPTALASDTVWCLRGPRSNLSENEPSTENEFNQIFGYDWNTENLVLDHHERTTWARSTENRRKWIEERDGIVSEFSFGLLKGVVHRLFVDTPPGRYKLQRVRLHVRPLSKALSVPSIKSPTKQARNRFYITRSRMSVGLFA